jgi:hypothetical protein
MSPNNDGASKLGRNPRTPGDYEIGYGRPPHEHQFKKGDPSRNPKGRSPGGSKPAPDLAGTLLEPVAIKMKGKERKVPYMEALLQVTKDKAKRRVEKSCSSGPRARSFRSCIVGRRRPNLLCLVHPWIKNVWYN